MRNLVCLTPPSLQKLGKTQTEVFPISRFLVQSLIKENCHNSKTSDYIDTKLGSVTNLNKINKATLKRFDDDFISTNSDVIVISPIYDQFGAIRNPHSGSIVCKTYIFINNNLLSYKNWKQNQNFSSAALTLSLWVKVLFLTKNADFFAKQNADINKIMGALILKGILSETAYMFVLTHQISSF